MYSYDIVRMHAQHVIYVHKVCMTLRSLLTRPNFDATLPKYVMVEIGKPFQIYYSVFNTIFYACSNRHIVYAMSATVLGQQAAVPGVDPHNKLIFMPG